MHAAPKRRRGKHVRTRTQSRANGRIFTRAFGIALIAASLALAAFPNAAQAYDTWRASQLFSEMQDAISRENPTLAALSIEQAERYNAELASGAAHELPYEEQLSLEGDNIVCWLDIPKLGQKIPVRRGTSDEALMAGAGHLATSSLPVGGQASNTVIAGHSGMRTMRMFDRLDELAEGDELVLWTQGVPYAYRVTDEKLVEPESRDDIVLPKSGDELTLVTCRPIGINSKRLIVKAQRSAYDSGAQATLPRTGDVSPVHLVTLAVLAAASAAWCALGPARRKRMMVAAALLGLTCLAGFIAPIPAFADDSAPVFENTGDSGTPLNDVSEEVVEYGAFPSANPRAEDASSGFAGGTAVSLKGSSPEFRLSAATLLTATSNGYTRTSSSSRNAWKTGGKHYLELPGYGTATLNFTSDTAMYNDWTVSNGSARTVGISLSDPTGRFQLLTTSAKTTRTRWANASNSSTAARYLYFEVHMKVLVPTGYHGSGYSRNLTTIMHYPYRNIEAKKLFNWTTETSDNAMGNWSSEDTWRDVWFSFNAEAVGLLTLSTTNSSGGYDRVNNATTTLDLSPNSYWLNINCYNPSGEEAATQAATFDISFDDQSTWYSGWGNEDGRSIDFNRYVYLRNISPKAGYSISAIEGLENLGNGIYRYYQGVGSHVINIRTASNTYSITYRPNGGDGPSIADTCTFETPYTTRSNMFSKTGYHWIGWMDANGTDWTPFVGTGRTWSWAHDVTLDAQWAPNAYTVTFDANGGTGTMRDLEMTYDEISNMPKNEFTPPSPSAEFIGWNTEPDGSGASFASGDEIFNLATDGTITVYAQWDNRILMPMTGISTTSEAPRALAVLALFLIGATLLHRERINELRHLHALRSISNSSRPS